MNNDETPVEDLLVPFRLVCREALWGMSHAEREHDRETALRICSAIYRLVGQLAASARHGSATKAEINAVLSEERSRLEREVTPEPSSGDPDDHLRERDTTDDPSDSCVDRAWSLANRGDPDGALALLKEEERVCRERGDHDGLSAVLGLQAVILSLRGDSEGALRLHREEELICRDIGSLDGLQASLGNRAIVMDARSDLDGALAPV